MAITMKATRAAIKTAKNIEELAAQVAGIQEQLNRIEDVLPQVIGDAVTRNLDKLLKAAGIGEEPEAKPAAKPKGK